MKNVAWYVKGGKNRFIGNQILFRFINGVRTANESTNVLR